MKPSYSEDFDGLRMIVGLYSEDFLEPDTELVINVHIKANHPYVKYPDGNSPPSWEISGKVGFVGD